MSLSFRYYNDQNLTSPLLGGGGIPQGDDSGEVLQYFINQRKTVDDIQNIVNNTLSGAQPGGGVAPTPQFQQPQLTPQQQLQNAMPSVPPGQDPVQQRAQQMMDPGSLFQAYRQMAPMFNMWNQATTQQQLRASAPSFGGYGGLLGVRPNLSGLLG